MSGSVTTPRRMRKSDIEIMRRAAVNPKLLDRVGSEHVERVLTCGGAVGTGDWTQQHALAQKRRRFRSEAIGELRTQLRPPNRCPSTRDLATDVTEHLSSQLRSRKRA